MTALVAQEPVTALFNRIWCITTAKIWATVLFNFFASIGSGQAFANAKDFAVWLGITPKQFASGNKSVMAGISKRGDQYLRKQLIHGARAIISHAGKKNDALSLWITQLRARKTFNCTAVATAHKLARIMWTLLQKQCHYTPQLVKDMAWFITRFTI